MADFEVARSLGVCTATGRTLGEGETFYAVLFDRPEGFVRQDYSVEAWTKPPEDAFCFWKSQVPKKGQKKKNVIVDNDVLIDFFERLTGESEPVKVQFRFVLALMLMRKRLLRYEGTKDVEGDETWTMTLTTNNASYEVVNPHLQDDEIDAVSEQLTAILHGDFLADYGEALESVSVASPSKDDESAADETAESQPQEEQEETAGEA